MTGTTDYRDRLAGSHYLPFLQNLHRQLRPRTYLEIGVETGAALALASCPSIAIDPRFAIQTNVVANKPLCLMFQETSDRFFEHRDPSQLLGRPVDMAFLDGMHLLEFLLRDFINIERCCHPNALVLLHDCMPPHPSMTGRDAGASRDTPDPYRGWWTGDVWKIIPLLQHYRPDLSIEAVDCALTGLVLITRLDPLNTVLDEAYPSIVAALATEPDDSGQFDRFWASLEVTPSGSLMTAAQLAKRYGFTGPPAPGVTSP